MSKCAECGMRTSPSRRVCKSCAIEDRWGTPSDHFDSGGDGVRCWVQDINEDWHASMYFEDGRHVAACGEILETPVAGVKGDPRFFDQTHACEDCKQALEDDEANPKLPDGGEFERANDLATDGGEVDIYQWVLDNVHEYPAKTDSRWGCRGNLVHQGRKLDGVTKDDVQEAIARAVENEDLLSWHGLLARAEIETLREIVRVETEEHDITRQILVGKCNKLIATKKQEQADENPEREVATDGGLKEVFRRETIGEASDGGLQIGEQEVIEEIDDVCSTLEGLRDEVDNPEVRAALRHATGHVWRASVLQRVDENSDVRMVTDVGSTGVTIHGPDPPAYERERGDHG